MRKYSVTCNQIISTTITVKAKNKKEAEEIVDEMLCDDEIMFDPQFPEYKYDIKLAK